MRRFSCKSSEHKIRVYPKLKQKEYKPVASNSVVSESDNKRLPDVGDLRDSCAPY